MNIYYIPMGGRIIETYWVITKISLGDNLHSYHPVITHVLKGGACNYFDLTSNNDVANMSIHGNYC